MKSLCLLMTILLLSHCASPTSGKSKKDSKSSDKLPTISKKMKNKNMESHKGFFTLWTKDSQSLWEIETAALENNYLWLCNLNTGFGTGILSGSMGPLRVIRFRRSGKTLLVEQIQTDFKADPKRPESLGFETNYTPSVLARLPIIAEDNPKKENANKEKIKDTSEQPKEVSEKILVDASSLLSKFPFIVTQYLEKNGYARSKGGFRISQTVAYPENLEWDLQLDLAAKKTPDAFKEAPLPDARRVTLGLHFSLTKLSESDYRPRKNDFRVGYFTTDQKDISRPEAVNSTATYINRWDLRKKNPNLDRSEVEKPITFWITNNTPHEYRDTIKEGVLEWNKVFEKIGFLNAVECKIQADDAKWNVGDFRYSVIQWLTSNSVFFSGHGPSIANPLTGEIIRAHIRIEGESFHGMDQFAAFVDSKNHHDCQIGKTGHDLLTISDMMSDWENPIEKKELIHQWLKKVTMHEVGHTLGLRHNFKASMNTPFDKIHDKSWTAENGLTGSIMEYVRPNIHPDPKKQGHYYSPALGSYDNWAIAYGYTQTTEDSEEKTLQKILENPLPFSTDQDSEDPYSQVFDATDDPLAYEELQRQVYEKAFERFSPQTPFGVGDASRLRKVFTGHFIRNWYRSSQKAARFIAGQIHPRRSANDGRPLLEWVDPLTEARALKTILEPLTSFEHITKWQKYLDQLPSSRAWNWWQEPGPLTLPFEELITKHHKAIIHSVFRPEVFNRLLEHSFRESKENQLTEEILINRFEKTLLHRNSWEHWSRRNLEIFVDRLIQLAKSDSLNREGSHLVNRSLTRISKTLEIPQSMGETETGEATREGLLLKIRRHFNPFSEMMNLKK